MGPTEIGGVIIAVIAALGAWAAQRAAAKATKLSSRMMAEEGAYERARSFDMGTIKRQEGELERLRKENESLRRQIASLQKRLQKLEVIFPEWERLLYERYHTESNDQE